MACDIQLGEYLDGELTAEARRHLEVHLEGCAECRRRVEVERAFKEIYTTPLRPDEAPPRVRERMTALLAGLADSAETGPVPRRRRRAAVAAATAALIVAGV